MALTIADLQNIVFRISSNGVDTVIAEFPVSRIGFAANGDAHFNFRTDTLIQNMITVSSATGISVLPNIANNLRVNNVVLRNGNNTITIPVTDSNFYSGKTLTIRISVVNERTVRLNPSDGNSGGYVISSQWSYLFGHSYNSSIAFLPSVTLGGTVIYDSLINGSKLNL